jgi:hypothetical protein
MVKMMQIFLICWLVLALVGCNAAQVVAPTTRAPDTAAPTEALGMTPVQPTVTNTLEMPTATLKALLTGIWTPFPTLTPIGIPTQAPTLTATPYPPLSATGPYLAYLVNLPGNRLAVRLLNPDGSGREDVALPAGAQFELIRTAISPDGEWLAFHSGTAEQEPYDLRLNLLHLPDRQVFTVTQLLSADYPGNFETIAAGIIQNDPQRYSYLSTAELAQELQYIFQWGIKTVGWSPNGRYLAFAGQMDGPSSDIYRYDVQLKTITRLTDGLEQIVSLDWSPGGKWILHEASNEPMGEGWAPNLYAAPFDGGQAKKLFEGAFNSWWLSPTTVAVYDAANGPGDHNLRFFNVETDQTVFQWPDSFGSLAYDPQSGIIAISDAPWENQDLKMGIYLIYPNGSRKFVVEGYYYGLIFRGGELHRFVVSQYAVGTFGITSDGGVTQLTNAYGNIAVSPDYQWMLMDGDKLPGMALYSKNDEFVYHLSEHIPDQIIWRPDARGIFYQVASTLYYLAIPDGQAILVDDNADAYSFAWIK